MGGSDCEAIHDGWLAQPVNAWSSLAFVAAGAWVLTRRRSTAVDPWWTVAGAVSLVLVGAGSFAYHGPQPSWGGAAHDGSIALLVGVVGLVTVRRWRRGQPVVPPLAVAALVLGSTAWILGRTGGPLCDHDSPVQLHAAWHALAAIAAVAGVVPFTRQTRARMTARRRR